MKRMKRIILLSLLIFLTFTIITPISVQAQQEEAVRVEVFAFVDRNGDKLMSQSEGIENTPIILTVGDRSQVKILKEGRVTFSLPYAEVEEVRVEIPYLAIGDESKPRNGVAQIKFRLDPPELPVYLP